MWSRGFMKQFEDNFNDINDLIDSIKRGGDVEFLYKDKQYGITPIREGIAIYEFYNLESEKVYTQAEELAQHMIGEDMLCDIVADIKILFRSV